MPLSSQEDSKYAFIWVVSSLQQGLLENDLHFKLPESQIYQEYVLVNCSLIQGKIIQQCPTWNVNVLDHSIPYPTLLWYTVKELQFYRLFDLLWNNLCGVMKKMHS